MRNPRLEVTADKRGLAQDPEVPMGTLPTTREGLLPPAHPRPVPWAQGCLQLPGTSSARGERGRGRNRAGGARPAYSRPAGPGGSPGEKSCFLRPSRLSPVSPFRK